MSSITLKNLSMTIFGESHGSMIGGVITGLPAGHRVDTEKIYKDLMENRHIYKPDFTLDLGGDEVYVEYFGLSDYKDKTHRSKFVNEIFKIIKEEK